MDQENRDKLFRGLGDIKDAMVNTAFDRSISLADRASKNKQYSAEQRKQAREFGEKVRINRAEYNTKNTRCNDTGEIGGVSGDEEVYTDIDKKTVTYTRKSTADTNKASSVRTTNRSKKPKIQWTYVTYLNQLKITFKNGLATKSEIKNFILSKEFDAYGITIDDVQKDLQKNGIAKIVTEQEKEDYLEQERKARLPKVKLPERSGVESYMQVDSRYYLNDEDFNYFCT